MSSPGNAAPARAGLVLGALIAVAAVANLGLAVANVALPSIGQHFDASQTSLNLIAVGYSLGLAASVLYFGAIGDRYGRKRLLVLGMILTIPVDCLAAWAPTEEVLIVARIFGGLAAGMAYPTTLALITALWSGAARTRAIALWAATGGAISALGPLCSGILLEHFWWGSVFLITLPLAVIALVMAVKLVPSHVNESTEPVDNLGGVLSIFMVGALILGINFAPVPDKTTLTVALLVIAAATLVAFFLRQRQAPNPLYHLPRKAADLLGRRLRRDDRVRLADGRDVHRPAVPSERARLLDGRRASRPPGAAGVHGGRCAASASSSSDTAPDRRCDGLRLRSAWLPDHAPLGRTASGTRRSGGYAFVGIGVGLAGTPASTPDRLGLGEAGRDGVGNPPTSSAISAGRSCSRSSVRC